MMPPLSDALSAQQIRIFRHGLKMIQACSYKALGRETCFYTAGGNVFADTRILASTIRQP